MIEGTIGTHTVYEIYRFFFQVMQTSGSITFCSTLFIIILFSLNLYMEMHYYGLLSLTERSPESGICHKKAPTGLNF